MAAKDYRILALKYVLPYLRTNEDIVNILKAIGTTFNNLRDVVEYLQKSLKIEYARGVWLDKIGAEVGAKRDEMDFGDYFCVNRAHVNAEKRFYFTTSGENPQSVLSLKDAEFIQKILAYIGTNNSCATQNEVINIIKTITNAEKVRLIKEAKNEYSIQLYGTGLVLTKNTIEYIKSVFAAGVYIKEIKQIQ